MAWNVARGSGSCVYVDETDEVVLRPCMPRAPCSSIRSLLEMNLPVVKDFIEIDHYKEETFVVHKTLSDRSLGWFTFLHEGDVRI